AEGSARESASAPAESAAESMADAPKTESPRSSETERESASETGSAPVESESAAPGGEGSGITLSIREDAALKLLTGSLGKDSPYRIDELHLAEPNSVSLTGVLYPKKLSDSYNLGLSAFLPETLPFSTSATFSYTPETGVRLTPVSLSVVSLSLPMDFLPDSLYQPFADALNKELEKLPVPVTDITVVGNALVLKG
ncbi:MAG: hypothetical protein J5849_04960, partial [Clostridia bacterium]|nr:hypothetical protein [Clostridia bacterium]